MEQEEFALRITNHLHHIYSATLSDQDLQEVTRQLVEILGGRDTVEYKAPFVLEWSEADIAVITYGDTIKKADERPLTTLHNFLNNHLKDSISILHILPFLPFSSDDGYAVKDFYAVNPDLGDWEDIMAVAKDYRLMVDLVVNHASSESEWFANFLKGEGTGHDYFFCVEDDYDTREVVRPRTSDLLQTIETAKGSKKVWCTFSHDQIDLDFSNPQVLVEFVKIIKRYLECGVQIFRLDAVAFLWKQSGTNCLNLPEAHEVIRLLRLLINSIDDDAVIVTETNLPNRENLSYFGNSNEAHWIYNFSLPPLLVNTMLTGNSTALRQWAMSMPPAQNGTAYLNFLASHDGIGMRPAEGLLTPEEFTTTVKTLEGFGGKISSRRLPNGDMGVYEVNIALIDALKGTVNGVDDLGFDRFTAAHTIMLELEGVPAFYIHSLFGTENDIAKLEATGLNRAINRHQWPLEEIEQHLSDPEDQHARIFKALTNLIDIRKKQPAFNPNATQFTLQLGTDFFGIWRQSLDRGQSIFCITNISDNEQPLSLMDVNLIDTHDWRDLISGAHYTATDEQITLAPYQTIWVSNKAMS